MNDRTAILQRELEEVERQIAALEKATAIKPDYGLGEGDPAITRWEMDKALLAQLQEKAENLKNAMADTGDGGYGRYPNAHRSRLQQVLTRDAVVAFLGLPRLLRRQDADVAGSHLAPRCTR